MLEGNYWLDLIRFEKDLKSHIERAVQKLVGTRNKDSAAMKKDVIYMVARNLDLLSQMRSLDPFEVDYDIELEFDGDKLSGFTVTNVVVV